MLPAPVESRDQLGALHAPTLPPASPLRRGFVSPWPEGHGALWPPVYLLQAAREMSRLVGLSPEERLGAPQSQPSPGPPALPPLSCQDLGTEPSLSPASQPGQPELAPGTARFNSEPRESHRPRRLRRRVLILYYLHVFEVGRQRG